MAVACIQKIPQHILLFLLVIRSGVGVALTSFRLFLFQNSKAKILIHNQYQLYEIDKGCDEFHQFNISFILLLHIFNVMASS